MFLYRCVIALLLWPVLAVRLGWQVMFGLRLPEAETQRWLLDRPIVEAAPRVWIHAASNGELASARPLIRALLAAEPALRLIVTCNSRSGRDLVASWNEPRIAVRHAPHDLRHLVRRFLAVWNPAALVIVENELWPERLVTTAAAGVPIFVVAARMSHRSFRVWSRLPGLANRILGTITWLAPQDDSSRARFTELGLAKGRFGPTMVLKSAAISALPATPLPFPRETTLLAASTHEGEEEIVISAFADALKIRPDLRLILAPRHPRRRDEVEAAIRASGLDYASRSRGAEPAAGTPVYLADTLGEMDRWYAGAGITFVGGSLVEKGGHTPFEPAAHRSAILTGPHVANAAPAYAALLAAGGAREVTDAQTLTAAILALTDPAAQRSQADRAARALAGFGADEGIDTFLVAFARETGLSAKGTPDAVHT